MNAQLRLRTGSLALALMLATCLPAAGAEGASNWQLANAKVTVSGTSTLHDWTASATAVTGGPTVPAGLLDGTAPSGTPSGSFTMAVTALESGKDRMDTLMHEALGAPRHPRITFELRRANVTGTQPGGAMTMAVTGVMTIAGKAREITVPMQVRRDGVNLRASGSVPLKMTDFGVSPPTAMMGTIKTADAVVVALEATLKPVP